MDDLISRQDAIDALMEILDRPNHAEFLYTDEICRALGSLPSAQPELANNSPELNKLFGELKEKYEWAKRQEWIFNPLGYALYYVWKEYDERGELL